MWILSMEWVLLALLVFWCTGAFKRLRRLRQQAKHAWRALDKQFLVLLDLMTKATAQRPVDSTSASLQAAHRHLQQTLLQMQARPLQAAQLFALQQAWEQAQAAWEQWTGQAGLGAQDAPEQSDRLNERWIQAVALKNHCTESFNAAVHTYNQAIAQAPVCVIAPVWGFRPGHALEKEAAQRVQSIA